MIIPKKWILYLPAIVILLVAVGCAEKPVHRISHYLRSDRDMLQLHRVVFVELNDCTGHPEISRTMTEAMFRSIQDKRVFHTDLVGKLDLQCQELPLAGREALTIAQLAEIRQKLKCDAIMFGKVSHFRPYPRMQVGLYLKLLDLKDGKLVWAIDHIWDTTDKSTAGRIREFFDTEIREGYEPAHWQMGLMSPGMFQKFVAHEVTNTFPTLSGEPRTQKKLPLAMSTGRAVRKVVNFPENFKKGLK